MSGPLANDLRIGRIRSAAPAEGVRNPSDVLEVDLSVRSSARSDRARN